MDALKFVTTAVYEVGKSVQAHPVMLVTAGVLGIFPIARIYCRLTVGMCNRTVDMTGKTVIVTGANTGIGKATAQELAKLGARVILACRNQEKGGKAVADIISLTGNRNVVLKELDLCSFTSVRAFADDISKNEAKVDVLINNAGISGPPKRAVTNDGCELIMQSNHFGPFLLTNLLLEKLAASAPSRIINVSSTMYSRGPLDFSDLKSEKSYNNVVVYNRSKMANVLFTKELARRLLRRGITANCLHPGVVKTDLPRDSVGIVRIITKAVILLLGKTPLEGAQTSIYLAIAPELEEITGKYFSDCEETELNAYAKNEDNAKKLWSLSEKIVGLPHSPVEY